MSTEFDFIKPREKKEKEKELIRQEEERQKKIKSSTCARCIHCNKVDSDVMNDKYVCTCDEVDHDRTEYVENWLLQKRPIYHQDSDKKDCPEFIPEGKCTSTKMFKVVHKCPFCGKSYSILTEKESDSDVVTCKRCGKRYHFWYDEEDFYEDHYDDFFDYYDAEQYEITSFRKFICVLLITLLSVSYI